MAIRSRSYSVAEALLNPTFGHQYHWCTPTVSSGICHPTFLVSNPSATHLLPGGGAVRPQRFITISYPTPADSLEQSAQSHNSVISSIPSLRRMSRGLHSLPAWTSREDTNSIRLTSFAAGFLHSASALAATLDSSEPSGKFSGRGESGFSLLDRFIFCEPFWKFPGSGIVLQFRHAHAFERLAECDILDFKTLARFPLGAVRKFLGRADVAS